MPGAYRHRAAASGTQLKSFAFAKGCNERDRMNRKSYD